jgi:hypothetical protein
LAHASTKRDRCTNTEAKFDELVHHGSFLFTRKLTQKFHNY